ncbi:TPA: polyamine ABC transporter substrate-binding protein [Pseudomonas aeruginosa]|uniref:polyamine ABC transporter substrate-binding protein n=1 Tax=Pseudomonas TaxID=286 RepID=UPI000CD43E76|nr:MULTISPECIES: ABC transporter substrate-binding protein [Pseudomonas]MBH9519102.1 polyamine ABC transporter substrate-binding protein [Pseudomonas aeruginosa]MBI8577259.1 polyamine ABC transporter substrate-binding protein [Pseudomonas aeruginosa]MBI8804366.1 polyamine ABC transporter substrate-binding protein [Pseudomonas aeruginosa]MCU9208619.1 polyamine ABC transporter substrate-binding protein [Pseudomonas aeruginosa]MDA3374374.1 polyamine ABC transporter substrate-binding protein [Pseu
MKNTILATLLMGAASGAMAGDLTVVSFGGTSKDVQTEAFFRPFEKAKNQKMIIGEYNGEMGKIKAMVDTASVNWDVVQIEGPELLRGCDEGLFEHIDPTRLGNTSDYVPGTLSDCGAGLLVWSMVMAYDGSRLTSAPMGWADFWDTQKFPGKRSLRKGAKYTLEIALLADGVPKEDLYKVLATPEGVERAFRKLDQIKPSIQWWESGAQPMQFLASGDVVMSTAYNGRVFAAQEEGAPMKVVWNESLYAIDFWAIPKGSPNKQAAEDFIAFSLRPEQQKIHTTKLGYGSTNLKTTALLNPALTERLNTAPENMERALPVDVEFWVDHGEDLEQRFNSWAAKGN